MSCQQQFLEKFGGRHPPSKSSVWALSQKLETKGTLLDEHTGGRPKMNAGFGCEWDTLHYNNNNNNNVPGAESGHTKHLLHREKIPQRRRPLI
jgi:hypothetical protein